MASSNKLRLYATTAGVAAITATGAWYGAGINMRQEYKQQKLEETSQVLSPSERLSQLELSKKKLIQQREDLQSKIEKLESGKSLNESENGKILRER